MPSRTSYLLAAGLLAAGAVLPIAFTADAVPPVEPAADEPMPAEEAARTMLLPDGFHATLFAGEPDVRQPIGFCTDDRGRLWVAEAYNYPHHGVRGGDRLLIFEDTDGDGRHDRQTVFYDDLNYVTGVEVGFGGAWVMSPPFFYFIPDRDGDDVPDGPPEVVLDGFGNHANSHNLANAFAWGPDGWLYGTHGRTNWSMIGTPGTPEAERVRFDGGVWRYHPVRRVWEPFADGTTNPWGIDWNDTGDAFVCNCVDPHLFQVIQGGHYEPWRGRESSRYAYERIASIADHLHFVGAGNADVRVGSAAVSRGGLGTVEEDEAGGGHAHCGTMVYLGDNWPDHYRGQVYMNNIHGKRINNDLLRRDGSGYVASHGPDVMRSRDPWFVGVTLGYGPDGSVYVSDWSDTGECHSVRNTRRETGRIFRIAYGTPERRDVDIAALADAELVALQTHRNDWFVRHARRNLQERFAAGRDMAETRAALRRLFEGRTDAPTRLRAMWALHAIGGADDAFLLDRLDDASEYVRGWAVRLLCEDGDPPAAALARFRDLAATGDSAYVRLQIASALQRLDADRRWPIAEALVRRSDDATDRNLPFMDWYAIEPLIDADLARFVGLAATAEIKLVRRHVARRAASFGRSGEGLEAVVALLGKTTEAQARLDLLEGTLAGLEGRRTVPMPAGWPAAYAVLRAGPEDVEGLVTRLALVFDDPVALRSLRDRAVDPTAPAEARRRAIEALTARKPAGLADLLLTLVSDPAVRPAALRSLAEYDAPDTARTILAAYPAFGPAERATALQTLAARPAWAAALLDALEAGTVPRADLTAYVARQMRSLGDDRLAARVASIWGEVRETPADRAEQIAALKKALTPAALAQADPSAGRGVFRARCANCHRLFDDGGAIGPNLTGAQRQNLDYVLENVVDPGAAVSKDFQMEVVLTTDGRVVTGIVADETEAAVTLVTPTERLTVPKAEIDERSTSPASLMPDGLLNGLSADQIRDLVTYLAAPIQVPLPADDADVGRTP